MGLTPYYNQKKNDRYGYNIAEGLRNWRNAIADVDRNPVFVDVIGDSVTFGSFCSNIMSTSWVSRLRTALQAKLGNPGVGNYPIPANGVLTTVTPWTMVGTWNYNSGNGIYGRFMSATGATNTATIIFTGTSCKLIYSQGGSGAASGISVAIDSVAQTAPNCYVAAGVTYGNVISYSGLSAGSHTMVITAPASGYVYVEGLIAYNPPGSAPLGCYVFNHGTPSAMTNWFTPYTSQILSVTTPHLVIIALGINDARNIPASYYANMGTLISAFQAGGASVLLLPYYMINDTAPNNAAYQTVVSQQYQLADQYNCALVDIYARWGKSYTLAQAAGLMGSGVFNGNAAGDQWHPSDKGHRDIATALAMNLIGQVA